MAKQSDAASWLSNESGTEEAVLLSAKYSPSSYTCLRSLAQRGIHTTVVSPYENVPAFASRYCDESILVPSPTEDLIAYKQALLSLAKRSDIRTILPIWEEDTYLLSKYRPEFEEHISLIVPPFETLQTVHDQIRLVEAAKEAKVSVPETWIIDDVPDWKRELIVKSRYNLLTDEYVDSFTSGTSEVNDTLKFLMPGDKPDIEPIRAEMGHTPIVQEIVSGEIYCFRALYNDGKPVAICQNREIRQDSYGGGVSVYRESISIPKLDKIGRTLLDHLSWEGLADVEFLKDPNTDEFKLMDVNPRVWGSVGCDIGAGADFPYYYWIVAGGNTLQTTPSYETGFATHYLFGEFKYLLSVLRDDNPTVERPTYWTAIWNVVSSLYHQPHFDYLSLDDPRPFAHGVLDVLLTRR